MSLQISSRSDSNSKWILAGDYISCLSRTDQRIVRVRRWPRPQHSVRVLTRLDKMTTTNICHDICAWIDADVQLLQLKEISGRGHLEKKFNYPAEQLVTQH